MTAFVVPHRTTQTSARIWVAWWARVERPPLVLRVRVDGGEQIARIALDSGWSEIGLDGAGQDEAACQYQVVALDDLTPATTYELALLPADDDRLDSTNFHARGWVETLPDRLQSDDVDDLAQRPFTMLLGSCYSAPDDPDDAVSEAYRRLWDEGGRRPHLKVLCGDQVYLDQPAGPPMSDRKSSEELRRWMISKYREAWRSLRDTLQRGANCLTSDDHEFWNDYPERPVFWAWRALHESVQYRRDWGAEAVAHFREIQQGADVTRLDIGSELSVFVADTRVNRSRGNERFMADADFAALRDWLAGLHQPGVLVLGQPLVTLAENSIISPIGGILTDHNLPWYRQYDELARALRACRHDVVVLCGDVHFGRIARFVYEGSDVEPVLVHEVVSSGMTVLPSAKSHFAIHAGEFGSFPAGRPHRPPHDPVIPVEYLRTVPPQPDDPAGTENHFMTLTFVRHPSGSGVLVGVRAWFVNRDHAAAEPFLGWHHFIALDVGRPPTDGSVEERVITHAYRDERGVVEAVADPCAPWSPRRTLDVVRDIASGRVRYSTDGGAGRRTGVHVVRSRAYGTHIRSNPDGTAGNNLDDLPVPDQTLAVALKERDRLRELA